MTRQEAMRILMLSPIYFKLTPQDRNQLIREYLALFNKINKRHNSQDKTEELFLSSKN